MNKTEFVVQDLLSKIYQDQFNNQKLPNQRTLAKDYHVSRYTIQTAVKKLEEIGIIETVQGSGMFVKKSFQTNPLIFNTLTKTPYDRISSKVITLEKKISSAEERQIFQLEKDEEIWEFERVRVVNYQIQQIEKSKMPVALFPNLDEEVLEGSIQDYVQSLNFIISHYITSYSPTILDHREARLLLSKKNIPAMKIENRCLLEDGRVYEYSELTAIDYTCTYITPFNKKIHQSRK